MVDAFDGAAARLKSIELQGYKTFANRTDLVFSPTITAIVGPNGSGKSNIADAIRWVLGEQAYSLLRGKRTEDMIFSGSEERPRASMASVEITFDNSDGWLPIEFSEVSIGRRAYRDGQNEYLLNSQRVRLRDVSELLAKCGLAERTYTIIGQGLVDAALSLRAEERRQLFEEAAGIGLYRSRRDEALRRLDTTRRNLERVQDILAELRPRLRSLERQVKRAKDYEQVKQDLDNSLRQWYGYHWYRLIDKVNHTRVEAEAQELNRDELRSQQDEIESKMRRTRERVEALRSQLGGWSQQVSDLYRQREAAGRRLAVAEERLKGLAEQQGLIRTELVVLEKERQELADQLGAAQAELETRRTALTEARAHLETLLDGGAIGSQQRRTMQQQADEIRRSLEVLAAEKAAWKAGREQFEGQLERLTSDQEAAQEAIQQAGDRLTEKQAKLDQAQISFTSAEATLEAVDDRVTRLEGDLSEAEAQLNQLEAQVAEHSGTQTALKSQIQSLEAETDGVEALAKQLQEVVAGGKLERLSQQLSVGAEYQQAIEAVLGEFSHTLALSSNDRLLEALSWWEQHGEHQRAAFVDPENLRPPPALELPSDKDIIGLAANLVKAPGGLKPVVELILGRAVVVRDRQAARRLLSSVPHDARLVTLNGEIHYPSGPVVVGRGSPDARKDIARRKLKAELESAAGKLQEAQRAQIRAKERAEGLRAQLDEARQEMESARAGILDARIALQTTQLEAIEAQRELDRLAESQQRVQSETTAIQLQKTELEARGSNFEEQRTRLDEDLTRILGSLERAETSLEATKAEAAIGAAQQAVADAAGPVQDLEGRQRDVERELASWRQRLEASVEEEHGLRDDIETASQEDQEVEENLLQLQSLVDPAEQSLQVAERDRAELEDEEAATRAALAQAERVHSQSQIELARREEELGSMRRRIDDDFGLVAFDEDDAGAGQEPLPLAGLVERLPRISEIPEELEAQVNRLRIQLRRMGTVNQEARREFREVKERTEFLVSQVDDLRKAEGQIQEVIAELDLLMEREFRVTFEKVAIAFREMFTRLFGGGSARLVLTNPDDLTDSGIDIEARLPGRREQGLSMLSGGERSLTASALIFALLKVSPTPFCLLDEVDAMLDEANVLRYGEVLAELSQQTQFIVITHNRQTVQKAQAIYGVTMGDDSVSRLISLKMDEYEKEMVEV